MIYLIDFENVHEEGFSSLGRLGEKDAVFCFFTRNVAKISMSALAGIRSGQLHFIEAENGKQSLDLVLVSYLGYLIGTRPQELYYEIVSNDNGFGKVAEFWNRRGNGIRVRIRKTNDIKPKAEPSKTVMTAESLKIESVRQAEEPQNTETSVQPQGSVQNRIQTQARQTRRRQGRTQGKKTVPAGSIPSASASVITEDSQRLSATEQIDKEETTAPDAGELITVSENAEQSAEKIEGTATKIAQNSSGSDNTVIQKETKLIDPTVLASLEAAGINASTADFLQNQVEKYRSDRNMKQLVYRAVVRKYGQKLGTQIYNNAKKLLMK